jgi:hypothetical protein
MYNEEEQELLFDIGFGTNNAIFLFWLLLWPRSGALSFLYSLCPTVSPLLSCSNLSDWSLSPGLYLKTLPEVS